jgi:phage pi2 protein 07
MNFLNVFPIILFFSLFIACQNNAQNGGGYPSSYQQTGYNSYPASGNSNALEMKPMTDPRTGRVTSYLPLPASWNMVSNGAGVQGIEGPNGIRVHFAPTETYYFNIDPYVAQMSGKTVANPIPLETIFQNNLVPMIKQQGGNLLKQYNLPKIAERNHQLLQQGMNRSRIQSVSVVASEWKQPNGNNSLILMSQVIMQGQAGGVWILLVAELEAAPRFFEQAKDTYLYAQANWQPDQQTALAHARDLRRMDQESENMLAASRAAHNAKMRSNEAAFQERQRIHTSTYNDISDMSMQGYWSRSEMQDRTRNQEVNMIREENTMTNPWDNRSLQVQSGYQTYYINSQGDVIGSNDANFNPNVHSNYNHTEWRVMPNRN